jgi:hypothetical protein
MCLVHWPRILGLQISGSMQIWPVPKAFGTVYNIGTLAALQGPRDMLCHSHPRKPWVPLYVPYLLTNVPRGPCSGPKAHVGRQGLCLTENEGFASLSERRSHHRVLWKSLAWPHWPGWPPQRLLQVVESPKQVLAKYCCGFN